MNPPRETDCLPGPRRASPHLLAALAVDQRTLQLDRSVRIEFGSGDQRDALRPLSADDCDQLADAAAETARRLRASDQAGVVLRLQLEDTL